MYPEYIRNILYNKIKNNTEITNDTCWIWTGSVIKGVPKMWQHHVRGKNPVVIAYEIIFNIKSEYGARVHKTCDNILCINPYHTLLTSTPQYFWHHVDIKHEDECWEWNGYCDNHGYGIINYNGIKEIAPRLAYQLYYNKEFIRNKDTQIFICHTCDNPKCCNHLHLFEGTHHDNYYDMINKRRHSMGEGQHLSKLTEDIVVAIRNEPSSISNNELGRKYDVHSTAIANVRKRRTWKHIKP